MLSAFFPERKTTTKIIKKEEILNKAKKAEGVKPKKNLCIMIDNLQILDQNKSYCRRQTPPAYF
jgi:hypothetical protein